MNKITASTIWRELNIARLRREKEKLPENEKSKIVDIKIIERNISQLRKQFDKKNVFYCLEISKIKNAKEVWKLLQHTFTKSITKILKEMKHLEKDVKLDTKLTAKEKRLIDIRVARFYRQLPI